MSPTAHDLPGPSGDQLPAMLDGMYDFLRGLQPYGPMVSVDLAGIPTVVVFDLDAINTVFADKLDHIGRAAVFDRLVNVMGHGLITNYDWDTWLPRRKVVVSPMRARSVMQFQERMRTIIDDEFDTWPVGTDFELHERLKRLTLRVVGDLLFSSDLDDDSIAVIDTAVEEIHLWAESDPGNEDTETSPASFDAAIAALDELINGVIDRRDPANPGDDMVGLLVAAMHEHDAAFDRTAIRDEAVTMILAGHETVTNTLSFAIDLLGRNPAKAQADPRHIVDETLRLYPPVQVTTKAVVADLELAGVVIPAGWEIFVPEYVIYRDPTHFERPDEFLPERWADDSPLHLNHRAYFPFLTGPKFCAGRHFAILEATEAIARFQQRFTHQMLDPEPPWGREFATSFAPDRPLPIRIEVRP